jgi:MFS superfamily sulfate permease-like transporter
LEARGVRLLGPVPQGLPRLSLPRVTLGDLDDLLPVAMAAFLLGAVETAAIGRMFAIKYAYRYEPNREFLALSAANLAAGVGRGFPVSGGMSQSLVNEGAGARTPVSGFVASIIVLVVVVFFSGLLRNLPQPVLAAMVLGAVPGLIHPRALKHLWRFSRSEFGVSMVAMVGVLGAGVLRGVLAGAILSLVLLLRRSSRPPTTELGRVPGTESYGDRIRHPEYLVEPDVFIFRSEGALLYFNAEHVRDRLFELLDARAAGVRLAVIALGTVPMVDLAGAEAIAEIRRTLETRGISLRLAEMHSQVRESLRRAGLEERCGPIVANEAVARVVNSGARSGDTPQLAEFP